MRLLLSFLPWIVFAISAAKVSLFASLIMAGMVATVFSIIFSSQRKLLNKVAIVFFILASITVIVFQESWFIAHLGFTANAYLAAVVYITILFNKPFTIEYAKEQVSKDQWNTEPFIKINIILSYAWLIYFCTNALMYLISTYFTVIGPGINYSLQFILVCLTAVFSKYFPAWYVRHISWHK